MKTLALTGLLAATLLSSPVHAFQQITHKRIAIDAVNYMKANPQSTEFNRLKAWVNAAGYSMDQFAEVIGQGAYDVDDFQDTYLCGAVR